MGSAPLQVAIVGAGGIAQTWAQAFAAAESATLVAVADVRLDAATALAEPFGAQAVPDLDTLLTVPGIDAVLLCTPPSTHAELAAAAAADGRHILCEKPLAVGLDQAMAMLAASDRAGVVLSMASKFRFVEDVVLARSLITGGSLGTPLLFNNAFVSRVDMAGRWNSDPALSGGGVLIDNGTHSVDIARYLLGPLDRVFAAAQDESGLGVDDTTRIMIESAGGALGTATVSWTATSFANTYVEVIGTDGVVRVGWSRSRFRKASSPTWEDLGTGYDKVAAHVRQLDTFAAAVAGEGELLIDGDDALASVAAIDAAQRSLASGQWEVVRKVRRTGKPET
jgi:predicted dehydrogenase